MSPKPSAKPVVSEPFIGLGRINIATALITTCIWASIYAESHSTVTSPYEPAFIDNPVNFYALIAVVGGVTIVDIAAVWRWAHSPNQKFGKRSMIGLALILVQLALSVGLAFYFSSLFA